MTKQLLTIIITLICFTGHGQSFEGTITYKVEALNPYPENIADSTWQEMLKEQFGERGYMLQKYFYKGGNYMSEIEAGGAAGFQVFNPQDGLIYSWQQNSDTSITLDSKKNMDVFTEMLPSEKTDTILGIPCTSVVVKSVFGQITLWYNSNYLKMDPSLFEGHIYGHWVNILEEIGCLPLKIHHEGFQGQVIQTAISFEEVSVEDKKFEIPEFKEVVANPMN